MSPRVQAIAGVVAAVVLLQWLVHQATTQLWAVLALLAVFTTLAAVAPWLRTFKRVGTAVAALVIGTGMAFQGLIRPEAEGPEVMGLALMVALLQLLLIASGALRLLVWGGQAWWRRGR